MRRLHMTGLMEHGRNANSRVRHSRDVIVKRLIMNFSFAETKYPSAPRRPTCKKKAEWWKEHQKNTQRPDELCERLHEEIRTLLSMIRLRAPYGCVLHEDVGIFRMLMDRELFVGFDVAVMLASVQPERRVDSVGKPNEEQCVSFWRWKKRTLGKGSILGFPVVWPEDPELKGA